MKPGQRITNKYKTMKRFKLNADDYCQVEYLKILPKSFDTIKEALDYATENKVVHGSYLLQHEEESEDIIISMQEIADAYESGECFEYLDII